MASPGPSHSQSVSAAVSSRTKSRPPIHPMGITAGAEDVKYQAKYKELKRKVKDIEAENDKLHFKVLNSKRNIQRMKLERAILYERLSNERQSSVHAGVPHRGDVGDPAAMEPDPNFIEYSRPQARVTPGRTLPAIDTSVNMPPMRRRDSGDARQLPPFNQLPPMLDQPESNERTRSSRSRNIPPPPQQGPYHIGPQQQQQQQQQYPDNFPPPMQHILHSPPLSEREREREGSRPRRHDLHELAGTHDPHGHPVGGPISPTAEARQRIHNHQRMGPGTYINRDERDWEQHDRDLRERDLNYSNTRQQRDSGGGGMHSPPGAHRRGVDYPEQPPPPPHHMRDYPPSGGTSGAGYPRVSRSGTPGSGSGSNSAGGANEIPSRPGSRGGYFDDRSRGYRLRPVNPTGEETTLDFVHEDGRSQSRDRSLASGSGGFPPAPERMKEMRKKGRGEMDVDAEMDDGGSGGGMSSYAGGMSDERDRGASRYHRASGGDNTDDVRMGP